MTSELTVYGEREIKFRGDPVCDLSESIDMTEWDERHLQLQIYAIDGGGFVCSIELSSSNSMIPTVREVEELDTVDDLEKFFFLFDPTENIAHGRRRNATSSMTLSRHQLSQLYGQLVDEALAAVDDFWEQNPDCERKVVEKPKEVNRVLKFLGFA